MAVQQLIQQISTQANKGSSLTDEQLLKYPYHTLSTKELDTLEKLSLYSNHRFMYNVLVSEYGNAQAKERFIEENLGYSNSEENSDFSVARRLYVQRAVSVPAFLIGLCTFSAFLVGLWVLPSRASTFKYTAVGFTVGGVASYAYWRFSTNRYYQTLNKHFRKVIKEKYHQTYKK